MEAVCRTGSTGSQPPSGWRPIAMLRSNRYRLNHAGSASPHLIRATVLTVREQAFVGAGHAIGCSNGRLLCQHIVPNCLAPYLILATAGLGNAILAEAALSFLGLGTPPPEPSWGTMLSGAAQQYVWRAPWMAIFPGAAISLAVFGFYLFGDALRDVFDPRLRGTR